jgi:hypothetical protein
MIEAQHADVVVRNAPPIGVVGADWFMNFPVDTAVKWATLVWILIQAGFYIYEKVKAYGSK